MKLSLVFSILFLVISLSWSTESKSQVQTLSESLSVLRSNYESVAQVRILTSMVSLQNDYEIFEFEAEVVKTYGNDALAVEGAILDIYSRNSMLVGSAYIVFLTPVESPYARHGSFPSTGQEKLLFAGDLSFRLVPKFGETSMDYIELTASAYKLDQKNVEFEDFEYCETDDDLNLVRCELMERNPRMSISRFETLLRQSEVDVSD